MRVRVRGRPPDHADRATRRAILETLERSPWIGQPTLQRLHPGTARAELVELQQRYRHVTRRRRQANVASVHWTRPGTVWAMDHTKPPMLVDGLYDRVLAVRDLPGYRGLAAMPTHGERADDVAAELEALALAHGAPLVLKSDNGTALRSAPVRDWASRWKVLLLPSPPYWPAYNGSAEAGIGWIKTRTHHQSAWAARPGRWTSDDLEAARLAGNALTRPWGVHGPTPDDVWAMRPAIADAERDALRTAYTRHHAQECWTRGLRRSMTMTPATQDDIERRALLRALAEHGYVTYSRRRIALPFSKRYWDKIS